MRGPRIDETETLPFIFLMIRERARAGALLKVLALALLIPLTSAPGSARADGGDLLWQADFDLFALPTQSCCASGGT
jgi:hypothetical protein